MHLRNLSVAVAIVELTLLLGMEAVPALASGGPDEPNTPNNNSEPNTPNNNSIAPSGVVLPDNSQQSPNIQNKPRLILGVPYWSNGNICRVQGEDMVCLTPQEAKKLRWPIQASPTAQTITP